MLRHAASGFIYGGPHSWVVDLDRGADLGTVERAVEEARVVGVGGLQIVVRPKGTDREYVVPLDGGE